MKRRFAAAVCVAWVLGASHIAGAGDPSPPPGPVTGTMKTLVELEPRVIVDATNTPGDSDSLFKIGQSGSYYLTGNITGVADKYGIEIAASNVTLDLMGFELAGVTGSLSGIRVTGTAIRNVTIRNGTVRDWAGDGVNCLTSATNCRLEGLRALQNTGNGLTATYTRIRDCTAQANGGIGIQGTTGCDIRECTAIANTGNGISVSSSMVTGCIAIQNLASGISATTRSTVRACSVESNTVDGIVTSGGCVIVGNTCGSNGITGSGAGLHVTTTRCKIEGNTVTLNNRGIKVDSGGNVIVGNTAIVNTTNYDIAAGNTTGTIVTTEADMNSAANSRINLSL